MPRPLLTEEQRKQIIAMYQVGEKVEVICAIFNRNRATVRRTVKRAGQPVRSTGGGSRRAGIDT